MEETGLENEEFDLNVVVNCLLSSQTVRVTTAAWRSFGRELGVPEFIIIQIENKLSEEFDYATAFYDLLSTWKQREAKNANLTNLINKLELMEWNEVIDQLRGKYPLLKESAPSLPLQSLNFYRPGRLPVYYTAFLESSPKILLISTPRCEITIGRFLVNDPNTRLYSATEFLRITSMSNIGDYPKKQIPVVNCEDDAFSAFNGAAVLAGNKVVFVTSEMVNKILEKIQTYEIDINSANIVSDIIGWNDLTPACQKKIENIATKKFQLERCLFQRFVNSKDDKTLLLLNILKSITLNETASLPYESRETSSTSAVHISRFIVQDDVFSDAIFNSENDDFYFVGIQSFELPNCYESGNADWILNNSELFFGKTKKIKSLHLMRSHGKGWKWLATRGNVNNIRAHRLHNVENNMIPQNEVCKVTHNNTFAISDKSGVGKTSLFQHMQKENQECIFVTLPKFIKVLRHHCENNENASFIEILKLAVFVEFWKSRETVESLGNVEAKEDFMLYVFLDDYEKLEKVDKDTANKLFNMAQELSAFIRFYVAGRSYVKDELETHSNALTVTLRPFELCEQIDHLSQIWEKDEKIQIPNLKQSATQFLESLSDEVGDITSFPLHCTLIGQKYLKVVRKNPNAMKVMKTLVKKKFKIYTEVNEEVIKDSEVDKKLTLSFDDMNHLHMKLGIVEFFFSGNSLPELSWNNCIEEILKIGIVETLEPKVKFIHKSFATYFAALWIIECLQFPEMVASQFGGKQGLILSRAFETYEVDWTSENKIYAFRHKLLCRIINQMLKRNVGNKDMIADLQQHQLCGEIFAKPAVSACVLDNFEFLFNLFVHNIHLDNFLFDFDLLLLSVQCCSASFVKLISNRYKISNSQLVESMNVEMVEKLLEAAVKRGEFFVFKYLVTQEKLLDCLLELGKSLPLNTWFENSVDENADVIEGMVQIIRFLGRRRPNKVINSDSNSNSCICGNNIHADITEELLKMGMSSSI